MISDKKSIALMSEEMKSMRSKSDQEHIFSLNSQINKLKQDIKGLKTEIEEYKEKDTKNKRKIK